MGDISYFMKHLLDVCSNKHEIGIPQDEDFWQKFAAKINVGLENPWIPESCELLCKRIQESFMALQAADAVHALHLQEKSPAFYKLLSRIFRDHHDMFSWEGLGAIVVQEDNPSTQIVNKYTTTQASSSVIPLDWELEVQRQLKDLVYKKRIDLGHMSDAESYLPACKWVTEIFLEEDDLQKKADMVLSMKKQVDEEYKKIRRN